MSSNIVTTESAGAELLPADGLCHDALARAVLTNAAHLPPGAVIAVQAPWGRGKTDILRRLQRCVRDGTVKGFLPAPLWINPWQYGTPDLLTPLVLGLCKRIPPGAGAGPKGLRKMAESLIRAGVNFGCKALSLAVPWGRLADLAAEPLDKLLLGLSGGDAREGDTPDPDPVAVMGKRFRELVDQLTRAEQAAPGDRLIVCVDDLDRCLPDRQVALLEALQFLISAEAAVTFFVALDPTLVREAVVTHYRIDAFDPDRYLDKIFNLRINLPAVALPDLESLVRGHLDRRVPHEGTDKPLREVLARLLGEQVRDLERAATDVLWPIDLRNPRIIRRIFDRLYLLGCAGAGPGPLGVQDDAGIRLLLLWLSLIERWPDLRRTLQHAADFALMFDGICELYVNGAGELAESIVKAIPDRERFPDLIAIMRDLYDDRVRAARLFQRFDQVLIRAGL
jgi:hypothetical protein